MSQNPEQLWNVDAEQRLAGFADAVAIYGTPPKGARADEDRPIPDFPELQRLEAMAADLQGEGEARPDGTFPGYRDAVTGRPVDAATAVGLFGIVADGRRVHTERSASTAEAGRVDLGRAVLANAVTDTAPFPSVTPEAGEAGDAVEGRRRRGRTAESGRDRRRAANRQGRGRRAAEAAGFEARQAARAARGDDVTSPADTQPTEPHIIPGFDTGDEAVASAASSPAEQAGQTRERWYRRHASAIGRLLTEAQASLNTRIMVSMTDERVQRVARLAPFASTLGPMLVDQAVSAPEVFDNISDTITDTVAGLAEMQSGPEAVPAAQAPEPVPPAAEAPVEPQVAPPEPTPSLQLKLEVEGKGVAYAIAQAVAEDPRHLTAQEKHVVTGLTEHVLQNVLKEDPTSMRLGTEFEITGDVIDRVQAEAAAQTDGSVRPETAAAGTDAGKPADAAATVHLERDGDLNSLGEAVVAHYRQADVDIPRGMLYELVPLVADYNGIEAHEFHNLSDRQAIHARDRAGLLAWIADVEARRLADD